MDEKGNELTEKEIHEKAQSLIDGKKFIQIAGRWEYSKSGRGSLSRIGGGIGNALPGIPIKEGQNQEYQDALKIIKEVEKIRLTM